MTKRTEKVKLGRFYRVEDPSGRSHPAKTFKAYKRQKKYDVFSFTSKKKKSYRLIENINPNSTEPCYVRKRPEQYGEKYIKEEFKDFSIRNVNDKNTLKKVKRNSKKVFGKNK